jgi:parallel beta-helix repeat protein
VASTTVYVNPAAKASGTGSITNPLNTWSGVTFTPGNTYLQMAGTTAKGSLMVTGSGTSASPIKIGAYGSGAAPAIAGSVIFDGASYVSLSGFSVTSPQQAAVVIQHGSNNIQVSSDTISDSAIGVWIGNAAGGSNLISANTLTGNSLFGLAVDGVSNAAGQQTVISGNTVTMNGSHGIELEGNNFLVQDNTVLYNGQTVSGSSGIHVYSGGAGNNYGNDDTITGNGVAGTHLAGNSDGNGIELDQWTHNDTVSANTICGNDGAGIILYDSWNDTVSGNMVFANSADAVASISPNGEIVLASSLDLTSHNTISGNVFLGISAYAPVAFVDVPSSTAGNVFTNNAFEDFGALSMYEWAGTQGGNGAYWRSATGGSDSLGGVAQGVSVGSAGSGYAFDFAAASPFSADFRFAWQTTGAYRA